MVVSVSMDRAGQGETKTGGGMRAKLRRAFSGEPAAPASGMAVADLAEWAEDSPAGFYLLDTAGRVIAVNRTFGRWLGLTPEAIAAEPVPFADFITLIEDEAEDDRRLVTLVGRDGDSRRLQLVESGGHGGAPVRGVAWDVSDQGNLRRKIRRLEQRFERYFEDAPVGIAMIGADCLVRDSNPAFRTLFGMDDSGREVSLTERVVADDRPALEGALQSLAPGAIESTSIEVRTRPAGGGEAAAVLALTCAHDENGEPLGVVVHALDATERRSLETQFTQ